MRYTQDGGILTDDGRCVPPDVGNVDYVDIKAREARGELVIGPYAPDPLPSPADVIDQYFPQSGTGKALFEAIFELTNRLRALEGLAPITRVQLKNWLMGKL